MAGIIVEENSHKNFQFFWHEYDAYGVFSQWFDYSFIIEGIRYANAEQYMMAKKALLAGDMKYYEMIMAERDPAKCKKLGKAVRNLNVKAWDACKEEVVYHANLAKFSQNEKALRYLLSTGDKILAEASPYDTIWGIGLEATHPDATCPEKWKGQNLLGKVLMKVRRELNRNNAWNPSVEERRKSMSLEIRKISITDLTVDAIVNAANSQLRHGGGVCGAIFSAAGPRELQAACDEIGYCETGSAVTTPGFRLKAGYVIHAVGPVWYGGNSGEAEKLYNCYQAAMEEARKHDCRSIAFPLISSGIYGYPQEDAWKIAIRSIRDWQKNHGDYPLDVVIAVIDGRALQLGNSILSEFCL